ncbi:glycosyltransferase [Candidatus Symbiobacter mobilis]|uniref:glycosyltransferase n=1 Tax=Candidatus Symbiobacter mobilis TaxID=1436290 RepID=UPI00124735EB|nr:glycosyltransferase [Candidatus Symbiobacter mobilis]
MRSITPIPPLSAANRAFSQGDFSAARALYAQAMSVYPDIAHLVQGNLDLLARRSAQACHLPVVPAQPATHLPCTALVIAWDVGHNALGRAYMLAEVLARVVRHVVLVGFQFPRYGDAIWEPLRHSCIPIVTLPGQNLPQFHDQVRRIVQRYQPDIVVACKPRLPSLELGLLMREQWGCPLIVDVDDHELSFAPGRTPLSLEALLATPAGAAPSTPAPYGELWTRLAHSLCFKADAILVSNPALQAEFGGTVLPHVRDERNFNPSLYDGAALRKAHNVPLDAKVVLFFGTARAHKGLDVLARAVSEIDNPCFRLLIVGGSVDHKSQEALQALAPGRILWLPSQPFSKIPDILSMADIVCLPQDENHPTSAYQLPAKAIDAIAMGIPLVVSATPPLQQLIRDGVAHPIPQSGLAQLLTKLATGRETTSHRQRECFLHQYSYAAAASTLRGVVTECLAQPLRMQPAIGPTLIRASLHALGADAAHTPKPFASQGTDIVVFWKQNDTCLYGRRHDMVIRYLASRPDVRRVLVFDAPMSEHDLHRMQQHQDTVHQARHIYIYTYQKLLGVFDTEKISYNVFVYPPGTYSIDPASQDKPYLNTGFIPYLRQVFEREGVDPSQSVFLVYPKLYPIVEILDVFRPKRLLVDVVDDHRAWPHVSAQEITRLTEHYRDLVGRADMVWTNCEPVRMSMSQYGKNVHLVPNGCDESPPTKPPSHCTAFQAFLARPGKTIGYVGNLESKIDIALLDTLCTTFEDCKVVLIGSTHANRDIVRLQRHPNVLMPGVIPYQDVGAWVRQFDVGIIPHLRSPLTRSMHPLKAYVYLAHGVPVVSTDVENIDTHCPSITVARDRDDFVEAVRITLLRGTRQRNVDRMYVQQHGWSARLGQHVDQLLANP